MKIEQKGNTDQQIVTDEADALVNIEVTEDMVSAGMDYLMGLDPERDSIRLAATRIYRAMRQIRIDEVENSVNPHAPEQCG